MIVLEKYNLQKTNSVIKLPSLNYSRFADCLESLQYAKPQFYKKYELFLKSLFLKCISYLEGPMKPRAYFFLSGK